MNTHVQHAACVDWPAKTHRTWRLPPGVVGIVAIALLALSPATVRAQIVTFANEANYQAAVGDALYSVDLSGGNDTNVSGNMFSQGVQFASQPFNFHQVLWSSTSGGIENTGVAPGEVIATFVGLANAFAFEFSASPTPPTVSLFDGAGSLITSVAAGASGFLGVVSEISVKRVEIVAANALAITRFRADQQSVPDTDTTAPLITGIAINPTAIDVTGGAQSVDVTLDLTDDLSGISSVLVRFRSLSQNVVTDFAFASGPSGDPFSQTLVATVEFAPFIAAGDWAIEVRPRDRVGNGPLVATEALAFQGFPTIVSVVSNQDLEPPQLVDAEFSVDAIDVSAADQPVTISLNLTDDVSGVAPGNQGGIQVDLVSPSGTVRQTLFSTDFSLVSGTPQNGVHEATLQLPRFSETGNWSIDFMIFDDNAGNSDFLASDELAALGINPTLIVTSDPEDAAPPSLVEFDFTPALVDATSGPTVVTATLRLSDDLAGIRTTGGRNSFAPFLWFFSPSRGQTQSGFTDDLISVVTEVDGRVLDGVFEGTVTIPQFAEQGSWEVLLRFEDLVAHIMFPDSSDLIAAGLRSHLIVVRPSLTLDGIVDPATGGTVTDSGSAASVTFPPGAIAVPTEVSIDVLDDPLNVPTPRGFKASSTFFVNIDLSPEPDFPLAPPGLTVVLPLTQPRPPGTQLTLYKVNPDTASLTSATSVFGGSVIGSVDASGTTATFEGVAGFSILAALEEALPGDLNSDDCIDRDDYAILIAAIRGREAFDPFLDLNGDNRVNRADARTLVGLFTNPRGAACS